eukprot:NODE_2088_length_1209_cov_7.019828_g1730_i0.p4 GENE.NODE_2088_length_1209_cov_7.019828_g1730_i0~~NODE_2088_length_1209_cov_7.019828_g1730_i0.p4  ORF type:complete len:65 (-),score=1.26 NODE_2088_length_1209_cov_7.019828_g1730_i0:82-276(-)
MRQLAGACTRRPLAGASPLPGPPALRAGHPSQASGLAGPGLRPAWGYGLKSGHKGQTLAITSTI